MEVAIRDKVLVPSLSPSDLLANDDDEVLRESVSEVEEWLGLVALDSPRVRSGDDIDSYLSRYSLPANDQQPTQTDIVSVRWTGFIPASWIMKLFISLLYVYGETQSAIVLSPSHNGV